MQHTIRDLKKEQIALEISWYTNEDPPDHYKHTKDELISMLKEYNPKCENVRGALIFAEYSNYCSNALPEGYDFYSNDREIEMVNMGLKNG